MSPSFPHTGTNTALAKMYAVEIHAASVTRDVEIADDLREREIDDRLVEAPEERAEDDGRENYPAELVAVHEGMVHHSTSQWYLRRHDP